MNYQTRNGWTSKRGALLNGVWHCDCEPRMPADKFQTKNGGKNHGRWFYTCQKPQPKRCKFFLWTDDAKIREESALLNNAGSESVPEPQTPRRGEQVVAQAPLTPHSRGRPGDEKPSEESNTTTLGHEVTKPSTTKSFDWPSSEDAELVEAATAGAVSSLQNETPRKTPRTDRLTSPGKRDYTETQPPIAPVTSRSSLIPSTEDDVFTTPKTSYRSTGLLSPTTTPGLPRSQHNKHPFPTTTSHSISEPCALAEEVLNILALIQLPPTLEEKLVDLLNKHDLRTQGIAKGRDITRLAVQAKEKKIAELQARIAGLESERETSRAVIAHLKADIAASPRRGKGRSASGSGSAGAAGGFS